MEARLDLSAADDCSRGLYCLSVWFTLLRSWM